MIIFKNVVSIIVAILAALVLLNAFTTVTSTSIHQIYTMCNYILATLMFIFSYLMADWTTEIKDSA
jgi:hypothetical protein|tara:strand:- start:247 stop:444 length:198 start_codon:yes stop_codon:yes gene_type:complete